MDNMDDAETNAKISDSAYSNSCSNSQSRRSHSSKSTHSGSNSSGSSGYGGKASTSGSSNILGQPPKKDKESKKKKLSQAEVKAADVTPVAEPTRPPDPDPIVAPAEKSDNVVESSVAIASPEDVAEDIDTITPELNAAKEEALKLLLPVSTVENYAKGRPSSSCSSDGFSCVISMQDGVVLYTTSSVTDTLGFPIEIWIGRSFIEFLHPRDHKAFSSLITKGLALPKLENGRQEKGQGLISGTSMVCRMRRYRSLNNCFGIKDVGVGFTPFLLKFFFKNFCDDDLKIIYLIIQGTPYSSAYKTPHEQISKPTPFVMRHGSDGILEYIDSEAVPYLGYLPQDIKDKNMLHLYHPEDLPYLRHVYETITKEGTVGVSSSRPYRIMAQNGDYIKVNTEWSSVVNPWSMKLEFVIAKVHIIEGPKNPDVFQSPTIQRPYRVSEAEKYRTQAFRDCIIRIMNEVRTKPAEAAKQQVGKRCRELASFMETLIEETPKMEDDHRLDMQDVYDRELCYYERDSITLGGISPHHDSDSKSSTETPLSYTQLNYNENLQRYFNSQEPHCFENFSAVDQFNDPARNPSSRQCFSPMAQNSSEFNEMNSNTSAIANYNNIMGPDEYDYVKLTETMIYKHNADMERELLKTHRESRSSKGDRERAFNESKKKKKEHLARCNEPFHPTSAGDATTERERRNKNSRGLKRFSKRHHREEPPRKHHCPVSREQHRRRSRSPFQSSPSNPTTTAATTVASTTWQSPQDVNNFSMFGRHAQDCHMTAMPIQSGNVVMPDALGNNAGAGSMSGTSSTSMPGPSSMSMPARSSIPMSGPSSKSMSDSSGYGPNTGPSSYGPKPGQSRYGPRPGPSHYAPTPGLSRYALTPVPSHYAPTPVPPRYAPTPVPPRYALTPGSARYASPPDPSHYAPTPGPSSYAPTTAPSGYAPTTSPSSYGPVPGPSGYAPTPNQSSYAGTPSTCNREHNMRGPSPMSSMTGAYGMHGMPGPAGIPSLPVIQVPYVVHPHPLPMVYGQAFVYPQIDTQRQTLMPPTSEAMDTNKNIEHADRNYEQSSEVMPSSSNSFGDNTKDTPASDPDNVDRTTDGESSYSSFYSSFFKTDSGSAEDSGDQKKKPMGAKNRFWTKNVQGEDALSFQSSSDTNGPYMPKPKDTRKLARRKMDAPWNEEVILTPDQIFKYQVVAKPKEEVLASDIEKMKNMNQPSLVNEQLGQLYIDLQLQGVAARLTLEEGITSSSSSGEDNPQGIQKTTKVRRRREFSRLAIIHEEDAPLPPPESGPLVPDGSPKSDNATKGQEASVIVHSRTVNRTTDHS